MMSLLLAIITAIFFILFQSILPNLLGKAIIKIKKYDE